ncbi:unnamed protein product [Hapterophycus canaliculatus]
MHAPKDRHVFGHDPSESGSRGIASMFGCGTARPVLASTATVWHIPWACAADRLTRTQRRRCWVKKCRWVVLFTDDVGRGLHSRRGAIDADRCAVVLFSLVFLGFGSFMPHSLVIDKHFTRVWPGWIWPMMASLTVTF